MRQKGAVFVFWSAGVLLFIVVTGHSPYKGKTHNDMLRAIMRARLPTTAPGWAELSTELQDLISVMLQVSEPECTREKKKKKKKKKKKRRQPFVFDPNFLCS